MNSAEVNKRTSGRETTQFFLDFLVSRVTIGAAFSYIAKNDNQTKWFFPLEI